MLVPMTKVLVVGHKRLLWPVVQALHRRALLHVLDFTAAPSLSARPLTLSEGEVEELERLRLLQRRASALDALARAHGARAAPPEGAPSLDVDELAARVAAILPTAEQLVRTLAALEAEQTTLPRHLASLQQLVPLAPDLVESESYETVALLLDRRHADVLEALSAELESVCERRFEMASGVVDADTVGALLVFPRAASARVHDLLGSGRVSRVQLPEAYQGLSFHAALARMEARLGELPAALVAARTRLTETLALDFDLERASGSLTARIDELEVVRRFGGSDHAFVLVGWLPERSRAELWAELAAVGDEVAVVELRAEEGEEPPVLLENAAVLGPYQRLVALFGIPRAGSIDPSGLMGAFMPLFFGMMLGDIGYGALLLVLAVMLGWRYRERPVVGDVARVLGAGAVWSVVWGALYGELFGDLGERWLHLHALWLPRGEAAAIRPLLTFAVAVGAAHTLLGLVLGIAHAAKARARGLLLERVGLVVALAGLFGLVAVAAQQLPRGLMSPAVGALVVGTVLVGADKGLLGVLMGPLEVLSGVGNVLSYLRIAAIGLASVYLAHVANALAATAPAVLGAIVAVLLHGLNLALGAFSPTIAALRLHYVELFGKFFEDGGIPYRPFGADPTAQS